MAENELNNKQEAFVEAYLQTWNATRAAKMAGYAEGSASVTASRLLANDKVASRVRERMAAVAMETNEVLARLASHARGDIGELVDPATMTLDLKKAVNEGSTNLIKKIKQTTIIGDDKQTEIFEFEMYDAQAALVQIGKQLGLFTTRLEHTGKDGGAIKTDSTVKLLLELSEEEIDVILARNSTTEGEKTTTDTSS